MTDTTKSIAVLPFVNMSADTENEYFSDGITEEIINALTSIPGLKVIARTSSFAYKGRNVDVRSIGKQLGVQSILEGSVRKHGNKLRITAQLINTADGAHLWAQNFDRKLTDIFELQDEISLLIAEQVRQNFGHLDIQEHLVSAPTQNIRAYELYLKGRHHQLRWNSEDLLLAVAYYKQAIELDASFALPYFGAGLCYGINASWRFIPYQEGIDQAAKYLRKGQQLQPDNYLAHFADATVSFWGNWQFKEGQQALLRALALHPSFAEAEEGLAELYTATGHFELALQHTHNALLINPLSPNHYYTKANVYYLQKEYDTAMDVLRQALQIDPQFSLAIELMAACLILSGNKTRFDAFLNSHPNAMQPDDCRLLFQLYHKEESTAVTSLPAVAEGQAFGLIPWRIYCLLYLDQKEQLLDILQEALNSRTGQLINFQHDPFLEPLQEHPRFQRLVQQVFHPDNLPLAETNTNADNTKSKAPFNQQEADRYVEAILLLLEEEKQYLVPSFGLRDLAAAIGVHPNKLSWLINECLKKNFNELINEYRLQAFKEMALKPENQHLSLLGLAYESGFNSKTVFNAFFKKKENMTPSAWVKKAGN